MKMVNISVASRAHRAFRDTARFHFVRNEPFAANTYEELFAARAEMGEPIGVYKNPDKVDPEAILICEWGLILIRSSSVQNISFSDIQSTRNPSATGDNADISIVLQSKIVVRLRVAGTDGRFRDVFSFVRFLDRVLEDRE
jgi:hypothetical protein